MPWLNEVHAKVLRGALYGGTRGGAAGAAASLASGAAIVLTTPAWLPFVGGSAVVALGTVAAWSMTGSVVGAVVSAGRAYFKHNREERAFNEAFPSPNTDNERNSQ
jgi:hypothetical protein